MQEGDSITIDAEARLLQLNVPDEELARRRAQWKPPAPRYTRGVLAKYARLVSSASLGAKSLVTALALLLVLPLLWAPVLAILTVAALDGAVIEYSTAYAGFRIAVSQLIYPLVEQFAEGSMLATAWAGFQILASIIGFLASALQVWRVVKGMLAGRLELTDG